MTFLITMAIAAAVILAMTKGQQGFVRHRFNWIWNKH